MAQTRRSLAEHKDCTMSWTMHAGQEKQLKTFHIRCLRHISPSPDPTESPTALYSREPTFPLCTSSSATGISAALATSTECTMAAFPRTSCTESFGAAREKFPEIGALLQRLMQGNMDTVGLLVVTWETFSADCIP